MCSCRNKKKRINGMKFKTKAIVPTATKAGAMAAGFVGARMLNSVPMFMEKPAVGGAIKLGIGVFLGSTQKGIVGDIGMGVAIDGALSVVGHLTQKEGGGSSLIPPGVYGIGTPGYPNYLNGGNSASTQVHSVAGSNYQNIIVD